LAFLKSYLESVIEIKNNTEMQGEKAMNLAYTICTPDTNGKYLAYRR